MLFHSSWRAEAASSVSCGQKGNCLPKLPLCLASQALPCILLRAFPNPRPTWEADAVSSHPVELPPAHRPWKFLPVLSLSFLVCPLPLLLSNLVLWCLLTSGHGSRNLACFCPTHLSFAFLLFYIFSSYALSVWKDMASATLPTSATPHPTPGLHFPSESLGPDFMSHLFLLGLY